MYLNSVKFEHDKDKTISRKGTINGLSVTGTKRHRKEVYLSLNCFNDKRGTYLIRVTKTNGSKETNTSMVGSDWFVYMDNYYYKLFSKRIVNYSPTSFFPKKKQDLVYDTSGRSTLRLSEEKIDDPVFRSLFSSYFCLSTSRVLDWDGLRNLKDYSLLLRKKTTFDQTQPKDRECRFY